MMHPPYANFEPPGSLGDVPAPPFAPDEVSYLSSVPRGFFEIASADECSDASPAFVRGLLMPRKDFDAIPFEKQTQLHLPPRWTLYGGPIQTRAVARDWETYLHFWAQANGLIWVSYPDGTPCIVRSSYLPWPANAGFQWTWVREVEYPRRVVRDQTSIARRYLWEAPYVS
jgi:hypothetical protein